MHLNSIFTEAAQALRFNRQRSILTVISLAWGVACFVILYSYGEGFDVTLQTAFKAVGQDLIVMFPGQTAQQAGGGRRRRPILAPLAHGPGVPRTGSPAGAVSPGVQLGGRNN